MRFALGLAYEVVERDVGVRTNRTLYVSRGENGIHPFDEFCLARFAIFRRNRLETCVAEVGMVSQMLKQAASGVQRLAHVCFTVLRDPKINTAGISIFPSAARRKAGSKPVFRAEEIDKA